MYHLYSLVLAITLSVGSVSVATAQGFHKGLAAYNAGDYPTALMYFEDIADGPPYAHHWEDDDCIKNPTNFCSLITVNPDGSPVNLVGSNGEAEFYLGLMYQEYRGVPQDYAEAIRWYQLAADQGNARAQYNLGNMYESGKGVLQNYLEAFRFYHLVAEQGHASPALAQYRLGSMYQNGQGVTQNNVLAHMWYNIAAFIGSSSGYSRDEVEKLMTTAEVNEAQQMASECMSSNYQNCGY